MCNHWIGLCSICIPLLLNFSTNSHIGYSNDYGSNNYCNINNDNDDSNHAHDSSSFDDTGNKEKHPYFTSNGIQKNNEKRHKNENDIVNNNYVNVGSNDVDKSRRYIESLKAQYSIVGSCNSDDPHGLITSKTYVDDDDDDSNKGTPPPLIYNNGKDSNPTISMDTTITDMNNGTTSNENNIHPTFTGNNDKTKYDMSLFGLNRYVTLVIIPLLERQGADKNKS